MRKEKTNIGSHGHDFIHPHIQQGIALDSIYGIYLDPQVKYWVVVFTVCKKGQIRVNVELNSIIP